MTIYLRWQVLVLLTLAPVAALAFTGLQAANTAPIKDSALASGDFQPGVLLVKRRPIIGFLASARTYGATVGRALPLPRTERWIVPVGSESEIMARLRNDPLIEYAGLNHRFHLAEIPDDPLYDHQWYLSQIQAPMAWDVVTGSITTTIAFVDTGVDIDHPELAGKISGGRSFISWFDGTPTIEAAHEGGSLNSGNHYVRVSARNAVGETAPSFNEIRATVVGSSGRITVTFQAQPAANEYLIYVGVTYESVRLAAIVTDTVAVITDSPSPTAPTPVAVGVVLDERAYDDGHGHGTHTAGIATAFGNNALGIAGIDWQARVMPLRVFDRDGFAFEDGVVESIVYAVQNGAKVINLSLAGFEGSPSLQDAGQLARDSGVLPVAASGNFASINPLYPAVYPQFMAVGASDHRDRRANFSSYGTHLDLVAPGTDILSTIALELEPNVSYPGCDAASNVGYECKSGTSMSTPMVSATAALMWAVMPSLTVDQVQAILRSTADEAVDPATGNPWYTSDDHGFNQIVGYGRLNVAAAVRMAAFGDATVTSTPTVTGTFTVSPTATPPLTSSPSVTLTATITARPAVLLPHVENMAGSW